MNALRGVWRSDTYEIRHDFERQVSIHEKNTEASQDFEFTKVEKASEEPPNLDRMVLARCGCVIYLVLLDDQRQIEIQRELRD
jgi:hypothetical protein